MTKERPSASNDAPAPGTLATLGLCTFVAGLALGLFQPLVMVGIGATVVAGPTCAGLLFLLCVLLALLMGGLAFFGARWFTVPALVACGSLALGLFAGNWAAATLDIGFGSNRPAAVVPSHAPPARVPEILNAPATVILRLDGVPDFTPNAGTERNKFVDAAGNVVAEGVWGHWCYSGPDTEEIASVETVDSGKLGGATVWVELRLMPFGGQVPMSIALPRVQIRLNQPDGTVSYIWTGQGQVKAIDRTSGRVVFTNLERSLDTGTSRAPLTGELSWTCSKWGQY